MKANEQIQKLTRAQKAALLQGKTVWTTYSFAHADIPEIFLSDGPHGLRKQAGAADHLGLNASVPATCFPTAASMANSWNLELAEKLISSGDNWIASLDDKTLREIVELSSNIAEGGE